MKDSGDAKPRTLHSLISVLRSNVRSEPLDPDLALFSDEDWGCLVACARDHQVEPVLWSPLTRRGLPNLSSELLNTAAKAHRAQLCHNLILTAELKAVMDRLDDVGVPALALKGPVMAELAYQNLALRDFVDLDVLVNPEDRSSALSALGELDYSPIDVPMRFCEWNRQIQLCSPQKRAVVELHWAVAHSYFLPQLSMASWWGSATDCSVAGGSMRTLSMEHQAVYACIHGAKHSWSRLKWVADLAGLLMRNPALNWGGIRQCFEDMRSPRILPLGMGLANELFDSQVPEQILSDYRSDPIVGRLRNAVFQRWNSDSDTARHSLSGLSFASLLTPEIRQKATLWWGAATTPTSADFRATPLPAPLHPAYVLVRPIRLAAKFARNMAFGAALN